LKLIYVAVIVPDSTGGRAIRGVLGAIFVCTEMVAGL